MLLNYIRPLLQRPRPNIVHFNLHLAPHGTLVQISCYTSFMAFVSVFVSARWSVLLVLLPPNWLPHRTLSNWAFKIWKWQLLPMNANCPLATHSGGSLHPTGIGCGPYKWLLRFFFRTLARRSLQSGCWQLRFASRPTGSAPLPSCCAASLILWALFFALTP